jgi:ribosomal protein L1
LLFPTISVVTPAGTTIETTPVELGVIVTIKITPAAQLPLLVGPVNKLPVPLVTTTSDNVNVPVARDSEGHTVTIKGPETIDNGVVNVIVGAIVSGTDNT